MSISTCPFCGCNVRFDRPWQTEYLCGTIVHQDAPSYRGQPCEKIVALRRANHMSHAEPQLSADVVVSREEWEAYRELEDAAESALDELENHGECDMTNISEAYKMVQDARANHDAQDAGEGR